MSGVGYPLLSIIARARARDSGQTIHVIGMVTEYQTCYDYELVFFS